MKFRQFIRSLNLQLFGDGAGAGDGAAASSASGAAAGNVAVGTNDRAARLATAQQERENKRNPLRSVRYGRQAEPAEPEAPTQPETVPAEKSADEEWAQLKKGKFAQQYGRDVQSAIQERFKNQRDAESVLTKLNPMLNALYQKNGIANNDLDSLIAKVLDDDSLYEDEAEKLGMTVNAYKQYKAMSDKVAEAESRERENQQQIFYRNHLQKLAEQGEVLKQIYPDFDISVALNDEKFRRMTSPEVGVDVRTAYEVLNHDRLAPQVMQYGIEKGKQQVIRSIQANQHRPDEGANAGNQAAVDVRKDPSKLKLSDLAEIKRRVERGERISF